MKISQQHCHLGGREGGRDRGTEREGGEKEGRGEGRESEGEEREGEGRGRGE